MDRLGPTLTKYIPLNKIVGMSDTTINSRLEYFNGIDLVLDPATEFPVFQNILDRLSTLSEYQNDVNKLKTRFGSLASALVYTLTLGKLKQLI